nr:hypothetical protein [bacterium]
PLRLDDLDISNSHQQSNIEEKNNYLRLSFLDQLQIDNGSRVRVTKLLSYQTIPEKIYQSKVTKKHQAEIKSLRQNILQNKPTGQFVSLANNAEIDGLYNRLSVLLHPVTINELSILVSATSLESNQSTSFKAAIHLHNYAEKHQILHRKAPNFINYQDFKHTQIKSIENGKSDHDNIGRIINIATELINTNGYTPIEILDIINSEPSTLADKYLKLEKLFCQNLTYEQKIKRQLPFWTHKIIKRFLLENQPQENEMRQIRQNDVRQYKNPSIDKATIAKISFYNQKFVENFDEQNHHESDWHQFGIYTHSVEVTKFLKKIPSMFKTNQELTKSLDNHFNKTIDGISKKELFNLSGYLHDLGKYSARRLKFIENEQGNKKIQLKTNGQPNFTFKEHELDSSKIIMDDIYSDLIDIGLSGDQIRYIAKCAKLHYELGKLREIGKKTVAGFDQEFIDSELFTENALEIIRSNEDLKFEIGLFYLADSLGKYIRKLHKYRHLNQSTNNLSPDDLDFDLNFMNLTHTKAKNGIAQINPNLAAGKRYLALCLQSENK